MPTFDPSVPAAMQTEVNTALGVYSSMFNDPVTVRILFRFATTAPNGTALGANSLAQSNYVFCAVAWNSFLSALIADKKTSNDNTAVANLPGSALATNLDPTSANGRAVGLSTAGTMNPDSSVGGGTLDGIVTLNSGKNFDFDRSNGITAGFYDGLRSIEHEVDEVLGMGSILPATTDFTGSTAFRPTDLYRYSAPGTRSLSVAAASSYFSINGGTTNLVGFNQTAGGDYGDWLSNVGCPALVQDAFSCTDQIADISATSPEGVNLDVIGYDLAVPEPGSVVLVLSGAGLLALGRRRVRA